MARVNKKSRIKGLPPKIQLIEEDTTSLNSSERMFDDNNTIVFQAEQSISYPSKLPVNNIHLTTELSTSLVTSGKVVSGISDTWQINSGSSTRITGSVEPFRDNGNFASDGLSSGDSFYATGSEIGLVGEGFGQPVWSKTKIEIDISCNPCSFKMSISQSSKTDTASSDAPGYVSGSSYPMAYFNFQEKVWEGIGTGWPLQANNITVLSPFGLEASNENNSAWRDSITYGCIGFNAGILNLHSKIVNQLTSSTAQQVDYANHFLSLAPPQQDIIGQTLAGKPTDSYGFPYAPKFHATSSQLLNMSSYIDKPFLLEKVVLEISGAQFTMFESVNTGGQYSLTSSIFPATVNNFFILNQKKNERYSYRPETYNNASILEDFKFDIPSSSVELTSNSYASKTTVSSIRDLVTFGAISGYTNDLTDNPTKEVKIDVSGDILSLSGKLTALIGQSVGAEVGAPIHYMYVSGSTLTAITQSQNILSNIQRDFNIHISSSMSSSIGNLSWNDSINLKMPVRSPNKIFIFNSAGGPTQQGGSTSLPYDFGSFNGGSNGLNFKVLTSRRLRNELKKGNSTSSDISVIQSNNIILDITKLSYNSTEIISGESNIEFDRPNPYILFPEDQLVFGWQLPVPKHVADPATQSIVSAENKGHFNSWTNLSVPASGSNRLVDICQMSFDGHGKVVFYGSYIENDSESHSVTTTTNTNAIRNVLGE